MCFVELLEAGDILAFIREAYQIPAPYLAPATHRASYFPFLHFPFQPACDQKGKCRKGK
jgi:hypothetical protein